MIVIEDLTQTFGKGKDSFTALKDIQLTILENEFFTLLGPSGCGKTTLLRSIAGFVTPSEGSISLLGKNLLIQQPYTRPVNTVFQNYALFPHMTVAENVAFGLEMLNKPRKEVKATVDEMLQLVKMTDLANRKTNQISGGQQQRVALARALAPKPKVLLLDEPLSALDFKLRKEMQVELKRLQTETGITFVFVTHDQEEALTMSDRIAVMNEGKILQIGSPQSIYENPAERFVADFIGETNFLAGTVVSIEDSSAVVELFGGETTTAKLPESTSLDKVNTGSKITIAIRPEYADIYTQSVTPSNDTSVAQLEGTLSNIVYTGTDTRYHVSLPDQSQFVVRRQNAPGKSQHFATGCNVTIAFDAGVSQVLRD